MKKLLLAAAFAATFSLSAVAADGVKIKKYDDSKNISYFVLNQFNTDFSSAENVSWTITTTSQKADFTVDGVRQTAFYSLTGTYLGLTEEVEYKKVPSSAKKEIAENYKGYDVTKVIMFQAAETPTALYLNNAISQLDAISYFVDLKKDDAEVLVRVSPQGGVYFFKQVK
jgi:opacity protein-like surface antigen